MCVFIFPMILQEIEEKEILLQAHYRITEWKWKSLPTHRPDDSSFTRGVFYTLHSGPELAKMEKNNYSFYSLYLVMQYVFI